MNAYDEMQQNAAALRNCRRIYNTVSLIYAAVCLTYAASQLFMIILTVSNDVLFLLFDGIIFKILLFIFGYLACYKHQNKFAVFAIVTSALNIAVSQLGSSYFDKFIGSYIDMNAVIFAACIAMSTLTIIANQKYIYLSKQLGFPYFNQRHEEHKLDIIQDNIKSNFQQDYERRQKTSSDNMDDFINANVSEDNGNKDMPTSYEMEDII